MTMAQITTLTDRKGNTLYPVTSTKAVYDASGRDLDTMLAAQKVEATQQLSGYVKTVDFTEALATKQGKLTPTADISIDNANTIGLTEQAKRAMFDDLWRVAAGKWGDIDYSHTDEAGNPTPYMCNEIWMTYEEAVVTYIDSVAARTTRYLDAAFYGSRMRTNLPFLNWTGCEQGYYLQSAFRGCSIEVANLYSGRDNQNTRILGYTSWIFSSPRLREVIGVLEFNDRVPYWNGFESALEEIRIAKLDKDISLQLCSHLSHASLRYMVDNAANTSVITVTVHPDVYAKLTAPDIETDARIVLNPSRKSYTRERWEAVATLASDEWIVPDTTRFSVGDIMLTQGDVSDEQGTAAALYSEVTAVTPSSDGSNGGTLTTRNLKVVFDSWHSVLLVAREKDIAFATT